MTTPRRDRRILLLFLAIFSLIFLGSYASRLAAKAHLDAEIGQWQGRIARAQQRQADLAKELTYIHSDAYVQEKARDELGLIRPDEELVIVLTAQPPTIPVAAAQPTTAALAVDQNSNWRSWLALFGLQ
ncbi:MAG: septum formation initiator family protein [Caldilineaceae bacterium]